MRDEFPICDPHSAQRTHRTLQGLSMQAGVENYYAQLHPDGSRQAFFFNRYANVFLDLVVSDAMFAAAAKVK